MSGTRVTRALELAAQLEDAGLAAFVDVSEALANLPCVLVRPPALSFETGGGPVATWSLAIIASGPDQYAGWQEIDELLDQLYDALPLEAANPGSFAQPDSDLLPCYVATYQETVESA